MSPEENKAVVRRFFEEFASKKMVSVADEIVSEKLREMAKRAYGDLSAAFPDITYTIEDMVAEGDKVAVRITIHGTHTGQFGNIAPTGRKVAITRFAIIQIEQGQFANRWVLNDSLGLYQQLGVIPRTAEIGK